MNDMPPIDHEELIRRITRDLDRATVEASWDEMKDA